MGIFDRFSEIMKSNINALLDKCEDPAKMIDQTMKNLRENLAEVKKETAAVIANESRDKRALDECKSDIDKMTLAAQNALKANEVEDAKKLIAKKQQLESQLVNLEMNYNTSHENAEKMRQMHDKLVLDINALESRRDQIKATVANAKAQQAVNEAIAGANAASSIDAFNRYEQEAQRMLDKANAEAILVKSTEDNDADILASKYASEAVSSSVDDEVAKMKAELGL